MKGLATATVICALALPVYTQQASEPAVEGSLEVLKVQGNVWMIAGAGANIAVQAGEQGVIVVDTGASGMTDKVMAAIRGISTRPIRYIINTSAAPQHVGGNAAVVGAASGAKPVVIAQENVYIGMTAVGPNKTSAFPADAWPTDGYYLPRRKLIFNGEAIDIIHMPAAFSNGDSVVYFRGSNVLVAGDIFTTTNLPLIDRAHGGTYAGSLTALRGLLDIAAPDDLMEAGTYIIPGHGRICDDADLVEYHDMAYEIRDRVATLASQGKTLDQVKAAHPALGWEGRYGQPTWTPDMFIQAIYPEFIQAPTPAAPPRNSR